MKVVLLGVSFLEREKRYNDAINLFKQLLINFTSDGRRGYWTLRLSVDLENNSIAKASFTLGKNHQGTGKFLVFPISVKRKITEVHVQGRPLNCRTGTKNMFYDEEGEQCGVEETCFAILCWRRWQLEGCTFREWHLVDHLWAAFVDALFADVELVVELTGTNINYSSFEQPLHALVALVWPHSADTWLKGTEAGLVVGVQVELWRVGVKEGKEGKMGGQGGAEEEGRQREDDDDYI
ncbi:zinc ion binding/nucleic acid binding/hydrolase [Actinidia rufa]|uniref:Fanconi-associated nuclease n=1 Tax=Actinidia rufa TaxID=165716 RepID=A0A7J0G5F8_9ERIC|nr:zinc ion binding/nucleic acid binding/hydrolase [Actinidia rufa]